MAIFSGRFKNRKFDQLMAAVTDYGTRTAGQHSGGVSGEDIMGEKGNKRAMNLGAGLATLVSLIALLFSAFSFYETVLKQASLNIYSPPLIYMYRVGYRDVFAIPITVSNDGAQRGTLLSFDLTIKNLKTNKVKSFQNLNFGDSPKGNKRLFHAITIPGRSSYSDVVLFHALETGSFVETTGGVKLPLRLTLKANVDHQSGWLGVRPPEPIIFEMTANYIKSFSDMERGLPTSFHDERWENSRVKAGK